MSRFGGVGRLAIDYGGGGQKPRTFQMTPLSPNCSRKFMRGSVVVARPFVARHRSMSTYALTVSISPSTAARQTASGNFSADEADASEDDSSSESEDALDEPSLSPGNDEPQLQWAINCGKFCECSCPEPPADRQASDSDRH